MNKVPYEVLALEVDKLYQKEFIHGDHASIDEHLKFIETFIESCGWEVEEYMAEYIHRGLKAYLPPTDLKEQN